MISIIQDLAAYYPLPFTAASGYIYYPSGKNPVTGSTVSVLMVEECPVDPKSGLANEPTSWSWNIRVGDKIRINNSGQSYTVVGPMAQPNPELFVNDGPAGSSTQLYRSYNNSAPPYFHVEYLFLVNGLDDDNNGFVDDGWDGVDNNLNGIIDDVAEWTEAEKWSGCSLDGWRRSRAL